MLGFLQSSPPSHWHASVQARSSQAHLQFLLHPFLQLQTVPKEQKVWSRWLSHKCWKKLIIFFVPSIAYWLRYKWPPDEALIIGTTKVLVKSVVSLEVKIRHLLVF